MPVLFWIDPARSTYGVQVQASHASEFARADTFNAEPSLRLEAAVATDAVESELGDERLGLPENLPAIRFNPDGFPDEVSVQRIVIRQGDEAALEIVPTANRLSYEIRPATQSR